MPSTQIKAIFFDLDGTLRHSVPSGGDVFAEYVQTLGIAFTEENRVNAMRWELAYWANSDELNDDMKANVSDEIQFWIQYSKRRLGSLGLPESQAEELAPKVSAHMGNAYKPKSIVPDHVLRSLNQLKDHGYLMAVISNRDQAFHEELVSHNIQDFFHFSLAAGEVGSFKPDPAIFRHALKRVSLEAQDVVYVGDNYYADVVGSRQAGLKPVLYDPDRLFPEADCAIITTFDDLLVTVKNLETL